jgi:arsenite/tail-anchored protein-transporting ATPase
MSQLLDTTGDSTFLFVAGKGGTGKTTAAGALALEIADGGTPAHLISTDPAHSVADLLGAAPAPQPVTSRCTPQLTIEEFDAAAFGDAWLARAAGPVTEIIEGGTYLDAEDVAGFTRLALPGLDEMMAVLRLVDLAGTRGRVVVDTAPTGHALRLFDAGNTHAAIARALRAMAEKAAVVASSFARRQVRLSGESIVRELEEYVDAFHSQVLRRAAFIVAARADEVVIAETLRLHDALRERGLRATATVFAGAPPRRRMQLAGECFSVPLLREPGGCRGLRGWRDALSRCADAGVMPAEARAGAPADTPADAPADAPTNARLDATPAARVLDLLAPAGTRLLLFAGKGGVGKTTCAAAAAVVLAERRAVLLCSADPAGSLEDVLAGESSGSARLRVLQVDADAHLQRLREVYRGEIVDALDRLGLSDAASLDRRVIEALFDLAPPGIDEFAALAAMLDAAESDELVVLDTAPTGHFLRLLTMPGLALDWVRQLMRIIVKYRASGAAGGAAESLLQAARELRALQELLHDNARAGVVVITLDEAMVRAETERLQRSLQDSGIAIAATLINRSTTNSADEADGAAGGAQSAAASGAAPPAAPASGSSGTAPVVRAPLLRAEPRGAVALREFLRRWKIEG